jgi:outer membrane protein insertion porin family
MAHVLPLMTALRIIFLALGSALVAAGETRFRITGMESRSEGRVLELVAGRLEHVRASEASASRADDAAFLLRQVLRREGFSEAKVDWKIISRSEIELIVDEGNHLLLGKVSVVGVPAAEGRRLAKLYARPAGKNRTLIPGNTPFREDDVDTGLAFIRQELNAQGFWEADAAMASRVVHSASGVVNLTIDVRPGKLYHIAAARILSADGRGVMEAEAAAQPYFGKSATTGNLNAMRLAVEESFNSRGYPDAKIQMSRTLEAQQFVPEFSIDLGKRVRLEHVLVKGLKRTRSESIAARMSPLEGDWYDEAAMNKRIRGLLATGAFSSARVETNAVGEGRVDATLHLEEAPAKEVSVAAGVDSYQGFILRTRYADRNAGGRLLGFGTGFEFSTRGVLGETRLTAPWIFGSDVAATARVYALIYGREGYSSFETGLEGRCSWKIGDHYAMDLLGGYSLVNLSEDGLPSSELGETVYTQPRLRFTQTIDFRDSLVLPKSGWHLESPVEIGAAVGELSTSYGKAGLSGGWYHRLNADYQVGLGGEWGMLIPSGDGQDLPIDLRLFNGGSRSVRGFPDRELGPAAQGYPTGGEAMWNANAEVIRNLSRALRAVAFLDTGALSREYNRLGSSDVEVAIGLGLRLELPVGPIRLEYGYNLTKDPGDPVGTLHFAIGVVF